MRGIEIVKNAIAPHSELREAIGTFLSKKIADSKKAHDAARAVDDRLLSAFVALIDLHDPAVKKLSLRVAYWETALPVRRIQDTFGLVGQVHKHAGPITINAHCSVCDELGPAMLKTRADKNRVSTKYKCFACDPKSEPVVEIKPGRDSSGLYSRDIELGKCYELSVGGTFQGRKVKKGARLKVVAVPSPTKHSRWYSAKLLDEPGFPKIYVTMFHLKKATV